MKNAGDVLSGLEFHPLTPERWADFEQLFGERGACGGCWCMWWRLQRSEFERMKGEGNKEAMRRIVNSGQIPGILAFKKGEAVGWCSVAPRSHFPVLNRSRILKEVDTTPVWSVVCFFVVRSHRRQGISVELLRAAARYVEGRGGRVVEGYPVEPRKQRMPDVFVWSGLASAYRQAGFVEVARRSPTRPIMRLHLKE